MTYLTNEQFEALMKASLVNKLIPEIISEVEEFKRVLEKDRERLLVKQVVEFETRIEELTFMIETLKVEFERSRVICCGEPNTLN